MPVFVSGENGNRKTIGAAAFRAAFLGDGEPAVSGGR